MTRVYITAQGILYIQYLVITYNRKESEKIIYVYKIESLCCASETNTTLEMNYSLKNVSLYLQ